MYSLVVVVELANLGGNLPYLPPLQAVLGVEDLAVLRLELPQLREDVKGPPEVGLPVGLAVLRQVSVQWENGERQILENVSEKNVNSQIKYLRPLNMFLDLSRRWTNSATIFCSCSSREAISERTAISSTTAPPPPPTPL